MEIKIIGMILLLAGGAIVGWNAKNVWAIVGAGIVALGQGLWVL